MKLVKHKKVVTLRTRNAGVEYVLRDALSHAYELQAVIVIEVRKKSSTIPHSFAHSRIKLETMAWAMNLAQDKVTQILKGTGPA